MAGKNIAGLRGQTTIEFMLLLSVVVLLILAAITTVSDITRVQQNATEAVRTGVENASLSLLQQFAEQRVGLQLTNVTLVGADLVRLEVVKSDPYFSNQPAVMQVVAWNDYAGVMYIPEIKVKVTGPDGNIVESAPGSESNVTVTLARTITVSFVPTQIGNYNITAEAYGADGAVIKTKKVPFAVIGGGVGGASFEIEKKIVVNRTEPAKPSNYIEVLQLPNATVRSASLELLDMHTYVDRNYSFYAYDWVFKYREWASGGETMPSMLTSTAFRSTNSPYEAIIPEDATITNAKLFITSAQVWMGWPSDEAPYTETLSEAVTKRIIKPGRNIINIVADGGFGDPKREVLGEARLFVAVYEPEREQAQAGEMFAKGIIVNGRSVPLGTAIDLSPYLHGGENKINFTWINGTFTYRLKVTTG